MVYWKSGLQIYKSRLKSYWFTKTQSTFWVKLDSLSQHVSFCTRAPALSIQLQIESQSHASLNSKDLKTVQESKNHKPGLIQNQNQPQESKTKAHQRTSSRKDPAAVATDGGLLPLREALQCRDGSTDLLGLCGRRGGAVDAFDAFQSDSKSSSHDSNHHQILVCFTKRIKKTWAQRPQKVQLYQNKQHLVALSWFFIGVNHFCLLGFEKSTRCHQRPEVRHPKLFSELSESWKRKRRRGNGENWRFFFFFFPRIF